MRHGACPWCWVRFGIVSSVDELLCQCGRQLFDSSLALGEPVITFAVVVVPARLKEQKGKA